MMSACNSDKEITIAPKPEIVFENDQRVFTVKTLREVTVAPTYRYVDEGADYRWSQDGAEVGREPSYTFHADGSVGSRYLEISVTTPSGTASAEVRIDVVEREIPKITLAGADSGFSTMVGEELTFTPQVASSLPVTYLWSVDGEEVADTAAYTFRSDTEGRFAVSLTTENEDGTDSLEFTVEVFSAENMPFGWEFPQTEYNTTVGRTLRLEPVEIYGLDDTVAFSWTLDGKEVATTVSYDFTPAAEGDYTITATMSKRGMDITHTLTVHAFGEGLFYRPATSESSANATQVLEFMPAPGQNINEYGGLTITTHAEACEYALGRMGNGGVSLGAFGGYIVFGFDHSIDASEDGGYDLAVSGNAYEGGSEPAVVWVMQDENGDGEANDTWFELRSSEHGAAGTVQNYAVTYYHSEGDIPWHDNLTTANGPTGVIHRNAWHTQTTYYPAWVTSESYTLRGTRLAPNNAFEYSETWGIDIWVLYGYAWGYADNYGEDLIDGANLLKISNAMDAAGNPANLRYIDFVKIQSAVMAECYIGDPNSDLGEVSSEVSGVADYHLMK